MESPISQEHVSFQNIEEALSQPLTLKHHDPHKTLWIDLDAFKEFQFRAVVFHTSTNENLPQGSWPNNGFVKPYLFLFRLLTSVENNYWLTELEIASFVCMVKKVRHLIESLRARVIIQTDYSAILDILQQF